MKQFHHAWDVHLYVEKRLSALPALCRSTHDTEMSSLLALEFAVYCVFFYVWFKSLFHVLNVQGRSMYGHGYRKLPLKRPCVCLKCCNNKYRLDSSNLHTLHCHIHPENRTDTEFACDQNGFPMVYFPAYTYILLFRYHFSMQVIHYVVFYCVIYWRIRKFSLALPSIAVNRHL